MDRRLALLRAVNVGGRPLSMASLREIATGLGWSDTATFIQSGNLLFRSGMPDAEAEHRLEDALAARCGMAVPVMVRTPAQWSAVTAACPFPAEAEAEPKRLQLCTSKAPLAAGAAATLQARAGAGEQVREAGGALWIFYPAGVGTSKLTPALIDRAAGSPVTARNWRTALALRDLLNPGS